MSKKGVGTQATLDSARRDLVKAQDEFAAAQQSVVGAKAALGGDLTIETDKHPAVLAALAARDKAAYDLKQTTLARLPTASSTKPPSFSPASSLPPAPRCSLWSRPATPGSMPISRKRSSPI